MWKSINVIWILVLFLLLPVALAGGTQAEDQWYKFEDDYVDSGLIGTDLTEENTPTFVTGKIGSKAVQFDGVDQRATTLGGSKTYDQVMISYWFRPITITGSDRPLDTQTDTGSGDCAVCTRTTGTGGLDVFLGDTNDDVNKLVTPPINENGWNHIVIMARGNHHAAAWVNGSLTNDTVSMGSINDGNGVIFVGGFVGGGQFFNGDVDDLRFWYNYTGTQADVDFLWNNGDGTENSLVGGDSNAPALGGETINNTAPRINDVINVSIIINDTFTDTSNIAGYIFSWDNGTGTLKNDSFVALSETNIIENVSLARTIEVVAGTTISYKWFANDTLGNLGESATFTVLVAGNQSPGLIVNTNNFFKDDNSTSISTIEAEAVLLNLSFTDDISLFGFQINITDSANALIFNLTNTTLSGTFDNFSQIVNVTAPDGKFFVNIQLEDSHTAKAIPDYKVDKGLNYLEFNDNIRIQAQGAIWASTDKQEDRYDFKFNYLPLIAPKQKIFFLESENELIHITDSGFKAHFVDPVSKNWIDFEGLEGEPTIEKLTNKRYKITFENNASSVRFNSIGGLNINTFNFNYTISTVRVNNHVPKVSNGTVFLNDIFVSFNVTGANRNTSNISLFDSSKNYVDSVLISNTAPPDTYFYNATFTGLTDHNYTVNITHTQLNGENTTFIGYVFQRLVITNDSSFGGAATLNFTISDEVNGSRIDGTATGTITYNTTQTHTIGEDNVNNFTIYIHPVDEKVIASYTVTYSAVGYQQRQTIVPALVLSSTTELRNLFLLADDKGIFGSFRVIDAFQNALSDVVVTMKTLGNDTIEIRQTDDAGTVTFWADPDTTYLFTFLKSGFREKTFSLRITSTELITVSLEPEASEQVTSFFTGIDYTFKPLNTNLVNKTDYTFVFNMTSTIFNITGCTLRLKNESQLLTQSGGSLNGSLCEISIDFNTGNQTLIIAEAEYQLNGTTNNTVIQNYAVFWTFQGDFTLRTFLDDITSFSEAGFDDFARFFLAVLVTMIIIGAISLQSSEFREPEILIPMTWLLVILFSYMGWFNIPLTTLPNIGGLPNDWLNRWIVFVFFSLGSGAYLIRRHL